jgi:hypothetical protein
LIAVACATTPKGRPPGAADGVQAEAADGGTVPDYPTVRVMIDVKDRPRWTAELEATGVRVVQRSCTWESTLMMVGLWGPEQAIERATALPFVTGVLAPGETPGLPPPPAWSLKLVRVNGVSCLDEITPGERRSLFLKIAGALDFAKRAQLSALGVEMPTVVEDPKDLNTIIAGSAPTSSIIPLAKLDFVLRIEGGGRLRPLQR